MEPAALRSFVCPITQEIMRDPVTTVDGHTYEREAIARWLAGRAVSPLTGLPLGSRNLSPNHALKASIDEFMRSRPHMVAQEQVDLDLAIQIREEDLRLASKKPAAGVTAGAAAPAPPPPPDDGAPVREWSEDRVAAWLAAIGMARYVDAFREALIDGLMLLELRDADLAELGVTNRFHVRKFHSHLAAVPGGPVPAPEPAPAAAAEPGPEPEPERQPRPQPPPPPQDVEQLKAALSAVQRRQADPRRAWALKVTLRGGHEAGVTALALLSEGAVASGGYDGRVVVWGERAPAATLSAGGSKVTALAQLAHGELAAGRDDGGVTVFDPATGEVVHELEGHSGGVRALAAVVGGDLASASSDGTVRLWCPRRGVCRATLEAHRSPVTALLALGRAGWLASGEQGGRACVWAPGGALRQTLVGHSDRVAALCELAGGALATGSHDGTVRLWRADASAADSLLFVLRGHKGWVTALAALPDGTVLASGSHDNAVKLWAAASGTVLHTLRGHAEPVTCLAALPACGMLASGAVDGTVRVWDPHVGALVRALAGHGSAVTALAVLPSGLLLSGSTDTTLRLWKLRRGSSRGGGGRASCVVC